MKPKVKIKLTKDCTWGKAGQTLEVREDEARMIVECGGAVYERLQQSSGEVSSQEIKDFRKNGEAKMSIQFDENSFNENFKQFGEPYQKWARLKLAYLNKKLLENPENFTAERIDIFSQKFKVYQGYLNPNAKKICEKIKRADEKLKSFLIEDRQKYESLGCGCLKGIYYFGTKFFKDKNSHTAIVTSDKQVYLRTEMVFIDEEGKTRKIIKDDIKKVFGLNYKDNFYDEGLDNIFSKEAVYKWLYENTDSITLKSIYEKLLSLYKKYIYLEDERKYSLLACYRIAGFFMPVWRARARLFIYAEMGSAKSRLTQILHNTGFNSVSLGDWTLPYLQRLIESTRGETHIDDFETLDEDKKNSTIRLIKTGFMKGFKAGKISEGKTKKPETYDLFNSTSLNNTSGLDFISTDRCITIRIPKISKREYDKEPNFQEPIWKELRDEIYISGLKYAEEVAKTYETINSDKIRGRLFFIIKPELTIAKLISQKVYDDIEDFWLQEIEQRQTIDYETDWEFLAYKQIYKLLSPLSLHTTLSLDTPLSPFEFKLYEDVIRAIAEELYPEDFKSKSRSMSIVIGNSLSRNPIFKKRVLNGKKLYKVKPEEFLSLLEAKGFLKIILEESATGDRGDRSGVETCIDTNKLNIETIKI